MLLPQTTKQIINVTFQTLDSAFKNILYGFDVIEEQFL